MKFGIDSLILKDILVGVYFFFLRNRLLKMFFKNIFISKYKSKWIIVFIIKEVFNIVYGE